MKSAALIGGKWIDESPRRIDVVNPATDEVIASVPALGARETQQAIEAAAAALPEWRSRAAKDRSEPLRRLAEFMLRDRERLAHLMTLENGKPLVESRGEITYAASFLEWSAEEAKRIYGETVPASTADKRILVLKQPVGVAAAITPWNFPAAMMTRKLGPALAAGCTMVIKPAEQTPLSALALGELAFEAGIPHGAINIITGDPEPIADEMLSNALVRKLSFTGSTDVGRLLMQKASQNITRLSLELGGHAPLIVFDDAELDQAVAGCIASKFRNSGQTCVCANRIFVQDNIYDTFVAKLQSAVEMLRVAPGLAEGSQVGPLIDDAAMMKVEAHVADALAKGATLRTGGRRIAIDGCADRFYQPTILEGMTSEMLISREETFGPVAPIRRFSSESEAIELANDSPYGLAAYFFTRDASRLIRVAEALDYGIVGANDGLPSTAQAPFGGTKHSGIGREGGKWGLEEYLEVKYVSIGL